MSTKLGTLTLDLVARISSFTQGMRQASASADQEMRRVSESINSVDSIVKKLAASVGVVFSVSQISGYADSFIGLQNRLKLVTQSQQELAQATEDTYRVSQITAQSWDSTVQVYQRFAQNAKALGINMAETAKLTETVSKAVAISGATAESSEAALVQFGQALSSGVLSGEEFRSISEQAGGLRDAIARGLNLSVKELREWSYAGKLTTDVIIKALDNAQVSVSELFDKTDFTGAQGWTLIQDATMKIVGEFSKATGASKALFDGLKYVSENIDTVVDALTIGTAFIVGSYIPAMYGSVVAGYAKTKQMIEQTAMQYALVASERTASASALAQAEAQLINTRSTLAAIAAEKTLELQRFQAQINAVGRMASTTRMAQLRQIEVQVTAELTLAETALANARARSTAAATTSMVSSSALLGVLGGPVGLGIMLASVAAGYLLMSDNSKESTQSLRENNVSVSEAIQKYKELDEVQRRSQLVDEKKELESLGNSYDKLKDQLIANAYAFSRHNDMTTEQAKEINALIAEYKKTRDIDVFSSKINALTTVNQQSKDEFNKLAGGVKEAGGQFKNQKAFVDSISGSIEKAGDKAKRTAVEVAGLSEELKKLFDQANQNIKNSQVTTALANRGYGDEMIALAQKYTDVQGAVIKNEQGLWRLRPDVQKQFNEEWIALQKQKGALDSRNEAEKARTKELEAQGKAMKVNALVLSNANKANAVHLEQIKNLPKGLLSAVNMVESPKSNSATSPAGAGGPMQFMPKTAKAYKVDIRSVESSYQGASEYLKDLLKMFDGNLENALRAYNWGEGNMQNYLKYGSGMKKVDGKFQKGYFSDRLMPKETREYSGKVMGYMGGASGVAFTPEYSYDDWAKEQEQFSIERDKREKELIDKQKQIRYEYATAEEQRETDLQNEIARLREAGMDDRIILAKNRSEQDKKLAQMNYEYDLIQHQLTEEKKLRNSYSIKEQEIITDAFLTDTQTKQKLEALKSMFDQEFALFKIAQSKEVLENKRAWMDKAEYAREYYAIVREEILSTANYTPEQKQSYIKQANAEQSIDENADREDLWQDYQRNYEPRNYLTEELEFLKKVRAEGLITESEYFTARAKLQAEWAHGYFSSTADALKSVLGENSKAYKTAFMMQKAAAMAQVALNAPTTFSNVYASASSVPLIGPYIAPVLAGGAVALQMDQAARLGNVRLTGMAHDGIDRVPREGTWLLKEGERVTTEQTSSKLDKTLDEVRMGNNSKSNITINVPPGYIAEHRTDSSGDVIDIVKREVAQSWQRVRKSNSDESRALQQTFGLAPARGG